jgi:hypothetical protein
MNRNEFLETLPHETVCGSCGTVLGDLDWAVSPFEKTPEWVGVCIVRCRCGWVRMAAAGSSDDAHEHAQSIRSKVMRSIGK